MTNKLGKKIAEGACAEVFEWEDGSGSKVLKWAKANTNDDAMRREYEINCIVWDGGLPIAQPFELVELDGRIGIVFERVYGETVMVRLIRNGLLLAESEGKSGEGEEIRMIAREMARIHQSSGVQLPTLQKDMLVYSINNPSFLTAEEKDAVIAILNNLPAKLVPCHGDPNPYNLLVQTDGSVVVIDWMCASMGNPEADLAEFILMMRYAILPSGIPDTICKQFDRLREHMIEVFMDEYEQHGDVTYEDVQPWILPVAARKLNADGITEEEKMLLVQEIRKGLAILA